MSTVEEPVAEKVPRLDSPTPSDKETDTFEDAIDTGSVRSLTNRKISQPKSPPSASVDAEGVPDALESPAVDIEKPNGHTAVDGAVENTDDLSGTVATNSARTSKRLSNVSLDNVDLDDGPSLGPSIEQPKEEQTVPEVEKQPKKKLSLSNIAASLPAMPWSPSNGESPPKLSPVAPTSETAVPPPPPPPTRKITSPFSWLSRNSGHKETVIPPTLASTGTPRRNTGSSIATLTSNPEMMLSKLEEEHESTDVIGGARPSRNSLRDRFKMVRLREEAGISLQPGDDEQPQSVVANLIPRSNTAIMSPGIEGEGANAQGPTSPLPPADTNLAPGTVSGVSAGPSAIADTPVDWDLWQSVVYEGPAAVARTSPEELNRAIASGIPSAIRGVVWQVLAQSKNEDLEMVYKELASRGTEKDKNRNSNSTAASITSGSNLGTEKEPAASSASSTKSEQSGVSGKRLPGTPPEPSEAALKAQALAASEKKKKEKEDAAALQKLEKIIRRDLGARTSYSKYAAAAGLQDGLFGVCKAYALYDEGVGYAQGMNFLIMPLLFNMPEEEAFCLLVRLMNQYKLRDLFIQDMPGLHMHLYQFERILEDVEPALYCHLHRRGISPHLYATQWFLTLFAYRFPLQLVLRIYDLILSEGLSAIIRFGVVLMQKNSSTLLGMSDMSQLTTFLKDKLFDVYIDQSPSAGSILENGFFGSSSSNIEKEVYRADQLVRDACEIKLTPELLKAYGAEWEEKTRLEKEREQELEQLRVANVNLAIKVRKLEERIEVSDREQADMANDLIHTKVENEELKDKNESLVGQVKELRVVIEKQPEEIEQAWQLERDDLMKRNQKVHEENSRLEKELSELEEQLVQTKMLYAEANAQHEALSRKWQDVKRQFA
ncbi:rab-GTPase-TBC domain-containing protein [Xylaria bambusicola]|uniref:rab-GTPase-TBC domain-containing protein n=1 Tax=Xylaria bambusicola TaxID=326684 RepID=UPI0020084E47|nr:rab-GTPase-TBC domain-containing protein [Xylaria bambusicola]KAI0506572.1 rab-GTPase-TBC domain-containing protein [Xylaria bambusicola]